MANSVKKDQLQTSLEKVKTYVDSRTPGSEDYVLDTSNLPAYAEFNTARTAGKRIWIKYDNVQYLVSGVYVEGNDINISSILLNQTLENKPQVYWFYFTRNEDDDSVKMTFKKAEISMSGADITTYVSTTGGQTWTSVSKETNKGFTLTDKDDYVNLVIKQPKQSGSGLDLVSRDLATKTYVDNQANSSVIKTETVLSTQNTSIKTATSVPSSVVTVGTTTYTVIWGQTTGTQITLSDNIANYDAIGFYLNSATASSMNNTVLYEEVPVQGGFMHAGTYPLSRIELWDATVSNTRYAASVKVGMTAANKIGLVDPSALNTEGVGIWQVVGIKYSHPVEYTTNERVIGTYLGKTLYEKTVECGTMPNNTTKTVAHGISNLDKVISMDSVMCSTNGEYVPMPTYTASNASYTVTLFADKTNISITTSTNRTNYTADVTLRYTKGS